jgi:hypothetical protein
MIMNKTLEDRNRKVRLQYFTEEEKDIVLGKRQFDGNGRRKWLVKYRASKNRSEPDWVKYAAFKYNYVVDKYYFCGILNNAPDDAIRAFREDASKGNVVVPKWSASIYNGLISEEDISYKGSDLGQPMYGSRVN